ncbi:hypothetical protein TNIN_251961 [Trichonephila inaurata madagascariensis]|uniref:Uncharacterized protein n=1 Tax=Trichonephila inaurata madagascariensis TaxID=2747483 RepID=A0A8X6X024_9ARAC|nr:hypothetical protein TNIN_251961 [Trichonephila inaurata madagascariensis]
MVSCVAHSFLVLRYVLPEMEQKWQFLCRGEKVPPASLAMENPVSMYGAPLSQGKQARSFMGERDFTVSCSGTILNELNWQFEDVLKTRWDDLRTGAPGSLKTSKALGIY